jgi:hypothetical protein
MSLSEFVIIALHAVRTSARSFPFGIDIGTGPAGALLTALEEWP